VAAQRGDEQGEERLCLCCGVSGCMFIFVTRECMHETVCTSDESRHSPVSTPHFRRRPSCTHHLPKRARLARRTTRTHTHIHTHTINGGERLTELIGDDGLDGGENLVAGSENLEAGGVDLVREGDALRIADNMAAGVSIKGTRPNPKP
jgi:hypothetical protein